MLKDKRNSQKIRSIPTRYKYIRQAVSLDGAGTQAFEKTKWARQQLYELFDRSFEENRLEHPGDMDTMEASNRYLTPKRDA